jgi:hypothetical protein
MVGMKLVRSAANEERHRLPGFEIGLEVLIPFNADLESASAQLHAKAETTPADRKMRIERQSPAGSS